MAKTQEQPQMGFKDEALDAEGEHAELYQTVQEWNRTREAAKVNAKAHREIQKYIRGLGAYDGEPHIFRLGPFTITTTPSDNPPAEVNFTRQPPIRMGIKRDED